MFGCYKPLKPYHMKKIYSLIFASAFVLFSFNSNAATVTVGVGIDASFNPANQFTPAAVTAVVGDVIQFILGSGTHNVTSTSVPGGAAAMSSGPMTGLGTMYNYTVTVSGTYLYTCTLHSGMNGTVNVTAASGISTPAVDLLTSAYPNPFKDKITFKYNAVEAIDLFNIVGEKVKHFELPANETKTEIDLSDISTGVYFIRTYKEGEVIETKKIVKTK